MISIKKGDQFKAADSNRTYKVVGKWGGNLVLAPVDKDNDECLIYLAEEIGEMVKRQKLAQTVSEVLNTVACYQGIPSYAYEIGGCLLDRQGTLLIGSEVDSETVNRLLVFLAEQGFVGEAENNADQAYSVFVVSLPKDSFTVRALENLNRLTQSKGALFGRAFGVDASLPVVSKDTVSFPWFPKTIEPDEINACPVPALMNSRNA